MDNRKLGNLALEYMKERRTFIGMFVLYQSMFVFIYSLYQLQHVSKLLYGVWISTFITVCYGIWDFRKYRIRIREIHEAVCNVENMAELLPDVGGLQERLYQELIQRLLDERQQLLFHAKRKETEMTDYYTLWAHQIKTPIAAMRLLLYGEKQEETYHLQEELLKIEQYVEMVLHYLRLENMSNDLLLKECNLNEIVNQAVKKHSLLFINSKLSFHKEDFQYTVITDEKRLGVVVEQLITNAVKYTYRGTISIYMKKDVLVMEDTGIGIRREDLPRVFERGFTGYNGRLHKKSTGIGLYLSKQILDKLSHQIEILSEVGKGTKVSIDFSQQKELGFLTKE